MVMGGWGARVGEPMKLQTGRFWAGEREPGVRMGAVMAVDEERGGVTALKFTCPA